MNRSEKLLEAIGQIDDRLILDAEKAGAAKISRLSDSARRSSGSIRKTTGKKRSGHKKVTGFGYRSALAACAVLAICVGIYGLLAKEGLMLSPFEGREESSQQTQIIADTTMEMTVAEEAIVEEAAVEEAAQEEAMPASAAKEPEEAAPSEGIEEEAAAELKADITDGTEGNADGTADGGQGNENPASVQSTEEPAEKETASESTMIKEGVEAETTENAESESLQGLEVASAEEPMVMSLRPIAEEVSDNDLEQIQDLPAFKVEAKWVKTVGTDVTVRFFNHCADAVMTYPAMYQLERQTPSGWSSVPAKENVAWVDMEYELAAGQNATETVRLETVFGKLEAGQYRLVKNCTVVAANQTTKDITLYTEFEILPE